MDNDAMVLAHSRALLASRLEGKTAYLDADIRNPAAILDRAASILNFGTPVAVVLAQLRSTMWGGLARKP